MAATMAGGSRFVLACCCLVVVIGCEAEPFQWGNPLILEDPEAAKKGVTISKDGLTITIPEDLDIEIVAKLNFTGDIPTVTGISGIDHGGPLPKETLWVLKNDSLACKPLDYEYQADKTFAVSFNPHIDFFGLDIKDINDNPPQWVSSENNLKINENQKIIKWVQYIATDVDTMDKQLTHSLTFKEEDSEMDCFHLDNSTGWLSVVKPLDFETSQFHLLHITVFDSQELHNISVDVSVSVQDEPDMPPTWKHIEPAVMVAENTPVGTEVATIQAVRGDVELDYGIGYIISAGNEEGYFNLSSTPTEGVITVAKDIDADTMSSPTITLTLVAYAEIEAPIQNISITYSITILNIDDNSPVFLPNHTTEETFASTIPEKFSSAIPFNKTITVWDPDTGINGTFQASLNKTNLDGPDYTAAFQISPPTGFNTATFSLNVINSSLLDYEDEEWRHITFRMVFVEEGSSSHTAEAEVTIDLTDINDNPPEFLGCDKSGYHTKVNESITKGTEVFQVFAMDRDSTQKFGNSSIRFSLMDNDNFGIDNTTGVITVIQDNVFDYETPSMRQMRLTILAKDSYGQAGSLSSSVELIIDALDVDDTQPIIKVPYTQFHVKENQPSVVTVTDGIIATDQDTQAKLTFSIDWTHTSALKQGAVVNATTYNYVGSLDIKTEEQTSENGLNKTKGIVTTSLNPKLDREEIDTLIVVIKVRDVNTVLGTSSATGTMTVKIDDINDNPPVISSFNATGLNVDENSPVGQNIFTFEASDKDEKPNLDWSIDDCESSGDISSLVKLSQKKTTADLLVAANIDRETFAFLCYNLTVSDGKYQDSVQINITVNDENDNYPIFSDTEKTRFSIYENPDNGSSLTQIQATDKDQGNYSIIGYEIISETNAFVIDPDTGDVTVFYKNGGTLDRETQPNLTLVISATDNYHHLGTHNTNTTKIFIYLLDVNDNPPSLSDCNSTDTFGGVQEDASEHTQVGIPLDATDPDLGDNGTVTFSISKVTLVNEDPKCKGKYIPPEEAKDVFTVTTSGNVGQIWFTGKVFNCFGNYDIYLELQDEGTPSQSTTCIKHVKVNDINNNYPQIVFPSTPDQEVAILREHAVNTPLTDQKGHIVPPIHATDADCEDGGTVNYYRNNTEEGFDPWNYFQIDNTGTITVTKSLEEIGPNKFALNIIVKDDGTEIQYSNYTALTLLLLNTSTSDPYFVDSSVTRQITENEIQSVYIPEAQDPNPGEIVCYCMTGNDSVNFTLHNTNLTNSQEFDREKKDSYELAVLASNNCPSGDELGVCKDHTKYDSTNSSFLLVHIKIKDVNDEPPYFNQTFSGGVAPGDSQNSDHPIVEIKAYDPDLNDSATYYIVDDIIQWQGKGYDQAAEKRPFNLSSANGFGYVTLHFYVQNDMKGHFNFSVAAVDKANHTSEKPAQVLIYIIDVDSRILLTFRNSLQMVENKRLDIIHILEKVFDETCDVDNIIKIESRGNFTKTSVEIHFIDKSTSKPIDASVIIQKFYGGTTASELTELFSRQGLIYDNIEPEHKPPTSNSILDLKLGLAIACGIFALFDVVLILIYCLRTSQLKRRVRALATTTFGSQDSGLNRLGVNLPNTNRHAIEANPVYNQNEKSGGFDTASISSGDSVLIGVEDNPEFKNYKNKKEPTRNEDEPTGFVNRRLSYNPLVINSQSDMPPGMGNKFNKNPLAQTDGDSDSQDLSFREDNGNFMPEPPGFGNNRQITMNPLMAQSDLPPGMDRNFTVNPIAQDDFEEAEGEINSNFTLF